MQRLKLLNITFVAIFALSVIGSATASAENPEVLPEPTEKAAIPLESQGGAGVLFGFIACEKFTNKLNLTGPRLGIISYDYKGCKSGGTDWNSPGDPKGTILMDNLDFHLVAAKKGTELVLGAVSKLKETLTVSGGVLKVEVKGAVMGLVNGVKSLVKTKSAEISYHQKEGKEEFTSCELDKKYCEENKSIKLEKNEGKGFVGTTLEAEDQLTSAKEFEIHF